MTDTLQALDVTAWAPATADTDEVAKLKRKVRLVADSYTKRYGWCDEVKKALREIGIEDERPIMVQVETSLGLTISTSISPSALSGRTVEQQRKTVAKALGEIAIADKSTPLPPEMITGWSVISALPGAPTDVWRRSSDGRVNHLWINLLDGDQQRRGWASAACGQSEFRRNLTDPSLVSERSCAKCSRSAAARTTPPPSAAQLGVRV